MKILIIGGKGWIGSKCAQSWANEAIISDRKIIDLYKQYVEQKHTNEWISEDELIKSGLTKKKRSNNILQSPNLEKLGIQMRPVQEAMLDTMQKYALLNS